MITCTTSDMVCYSLWYILMQVTVANFNYMCCLKQFRMIREIRRTCVVVMSKTRISHGASIFILLGPLMYT